MQPSLANQFDKLIIRPLQNVSGLLHASRPVAFVFDLVQNIDCDTVGVVARDLVWAFGRLRQEGVNAKAIITGVGYQRIVSAFSPIQTIRRSFEAPITDPSSFLSMARSASFPFLNWKYCRSEFVQRAVEMCSVLGIFTALPPVISLVGVTLLPSPLNINVGSPWVVCPDIFANVHGSRRFNWDFGAGIQRWRGGCE